MTRLMLIGALLVSLAVPVGAAAMMITSGTQSDQVTIQMPSTPTSSTSAAASQSTPTPATHPVQLFDESRVQVDPSCSDDHHLDTLKSDAVAEAKSLPTSKQALLDSEQDFKQFLNRHPEARLSTADYATYTQLKVRYQRLVKAFNAHVDTFDRLADAYNAALDACTTG